MLLAAASIVAGGAALASDQEGCLLCHRLELRVAGGAGGKSIRVYDPAGGSHDPLYCSDCHIDARDVPHPAPPGPAQCIGDCHGATPSAGASHRAAAFGRLTEGHRPLTLPAAPCRLCHGAADHGEGRAAARARCGSCHRAVAAASARGPHARFDGGRGACTGCHPPHAASPAGEAGSKASCDGSGCHRSVTPAMRSLAGHGAAGKKGGRDLPLRGAIFFGIAAAGWLLGGVVLRPKSASGGKGP